MRFTVESRIPQIITRLTADAREIEMRAAKEIAASAARNAPRGATGDLGAAYQAEAVEGGAGVMAIWRYYFTEFGTSKTAAQPHLIPAVETVRAKVDGLGREELKNL